MHKLDGKSATLHPDILDFLRRHCPAIFTEGKIDADKLRRTLGEEVSPDQERYGLTWAGKSECFRHIQEPTTATLRPCRDESVDFDRTGNLFIEGDNLEVLKVLQKSYYGRVKMIYIDPPYNTGNDSFIYPDRFKEERDGYEQRAGITDAEGLLTKDGFWRKNSRDAGHFHSNWLSMMYPRLYLARNLLTEDGVIFVSIDDNEVHNLRMVMNEIFGEENFVANIVWQKKYSPQNDAKYLSDMHDHILLFAKNKEIWRPVPLARTEEQDTAYKNPDNDPRGPWKATDSTCNKSKSQRPNLYYAIINSHGEETWPLETRVWRYSKAVHEAKVADNRIWWGNDGNNKVPAYKSFLSEVKAGRVPTTIWTYKEAGHNQLARQELNILIDNNAFDTPKPTALIHRILEISTQSEDDDIILDFFAGSATTAHAVMQLNAEDGGNRKFICVQMAEACDEDSEAAKANFKTIADIGRERIRRAARKIAEENQGKLDFDGASLDLGFKAFRLEESNFKQWRQQIKDGAALRGQLEMFVDNTKTDAPPEAMLYEIILKNSRFDLNVPVEKKTFSGVEYYILAAKSAEKEDVNHGLTRMNTDFEIICLAKKISQKFVDKIIAAHPEKFTCLDAAFKDNDQLKTNTALQMEAEKIEFKVI